MADNYQVRDGNGNLVTFKSKDLGSSQVVQSIPSDTSGAAYSYSNPMAVAVAATRATTTAAITISSSTTISASVDLLGTSLLAFIAPAAWTTSTLKIQGSADNTNWSDIFGSDGVAVSSWSAITATAAYSVDVAAMLPYRYIRFVAGTAQAADRTFTVITRPLA